LSGEFYSSVAEPDGAVSLFGSRTGFRELAAPSVDGGPKTREAARDLPYELNAYALLQPEAVPDRKSFPVVVEVRENVGLTPPGLDSLRPLLQLGL
jgi:hypothetical protein